MCVSGQLLPVCHGGVVSGAAGTQVHNWTVREHLVVDVGREVGLHKPTQWKTGQTCLTSFHLMQCRYTLELH